MKCLRMLSGPILLMFSLSAHAILTIEISGGSDSAMPIAIVPFGSNSAEGQLPVDVAEVITADLVRSGKFKPLPVEDMLERPHRGSDIKFENWRVIGIDSLVVGNVRRETGGQYTVEFQLFDVFKARQIESLSRIVPARGLRTIAHTMADLIYEALTGEKGAFNTRIAYVTSVKTAAGLEYRLQIADTDGHNAQTVLRSKKPIMSPSWAPDARRLAYVSFENHRPEVFIHSVFEASRESVAAFDGINGAPVWSPDGRRLALTLSHNGNPDIYILELGSKRLLQITRNSAIDTEPAWMPNGRELIFTSGRSGGPQLYKTSLDGNDARRLTFEGSYNASPTVSPDGLSVAMVHLHQGQYRIAVLDLKSGLFRILTDGRLDESPSFSPNGSILLYASQQGNRNVLAAVSVDGRTRQRLAFSEGDIREPDWAPFPAGQR
ncbi:MAG TPA: Tol-Pal system beta propeller repeat protein TolB [Gammaproteobacteria bacterium]